MTRIDFYVLTQQLQQDRMLFACRLCEKAIKQGNKVLIATASEQASQEMDDLLWSFNPESFVPHAILGGEGADEAPVVISHSRDDEAHHDVLVNLNNTVPEYFSRFKRVTEIVVQDEHILAATRKNWAYYKTRGYPLNKHDL